MELCQAALQDSPGSTWANANLVTADRAGCARDEPVAPQSSKVKRIAASTDWMVELELSGNGATPTRGQVYAALNGDCTSLLICVKEGERLTLPLGVVFSDAAPVALEESMQTWDCQVCARFKMQVTKRVVLTLVRQALHAQVAVRSVEPIRDWHTAVLEASRNDLDAAIKDIDVRLLDWQNRLWLKIVYGGVRSVRSFDPIFRELAPKHLGVKTTFQHLLTRYHKQRNAANARRVDYAKCTDPVLLDDGIKGDTKWARTVLDWFAERLVPVDLNRRNLYLWGRAGVGKTRFLERLLEAQECFRRDCSEAYFLQGLSEDYRFVLLDEFVPGIVTKNNEYRQQFNKLTGRERVLVRVKCGEQYEVDADTIRTVVSSNEPPPTVDHFCRRFVVIEATNAIYDSRLLIKSTAGKLPQRRALAASVNRDSSSVVADDTRGRKWRKWFAD